jgi:two-component system cell cycle response regulator
MMITQSVGKRSRAMEQRLTKALLVVDSREDSWFLSGGSQGPLGCQVLDVKGLSAKKMPDFDQTLRMITEKSPDVLLLDSTLARNFALSVTIQVRDKFPNMPVVLLPDIRSVLTAPDSSREGGGPTGLAVGADHVTDGALVASDAIGLALLLTQGQIGLQHALLQMIVRDDLTGLHNRRGFMALAERQLRCARDMGRPMVMFFADVDGLKSINDRFGHREGDRALARAAACIRQTLRKCDLSARLSGDEFVALVTAAPGRSTESICARLRFKLADCSGSETRYKLSLSVGVAHFDPCKPVTLHELMRLADTALYRHKRGERWASDTAAVPPLIPYIPVMQRATSGG